jgi:tetratricopeptide (TPR) repeat protein
MPAAHVERGHAVRRLLGHYVQSALRAALLFQPGRRPLALGEPDTGVTITSITDRSQAIAWLDAERPALIAIATGAGGSDPDLDTYVWQLAWCISQYLYLQGHWGDWERIQTAALDAAVRLDDRHAIATSHRGLGQALTLLGRDREAETHLTTARRVAREIGEPAIEALALQTIADLYARQGRLQESLNRLNDALTIFQKTGSELGRAQALNNIAMRYMQLGRYIEALDTGAEALSIFQGSGELHGVSAVRDTLANIYCLQGEYDQAIDQFRRALRLNQDIGERYVESETLIRLGELYEITGEHDTAVAVVQQALEILEELGHPDQTEAREKLDKLVGIGV